MTRSLFALLQHFGLLTDAAQQAVAHFKHHAFCSAGCRLVSACAQVDSGSAFDHSGLVADVGVAASFEASRGALDSCQAPSVRHRHGTVEKFFQFIAHAKCGSPFGVRHVKPS